MKEKKVTIEELARMVKTGFDRTESRFKATASKNDFRILVDEILLLRNDLKDGLLTIRSIAGLVGGHEKDIRAIKREVGITE
jgi:hypothetical protein